jgi:hypothetical protein
MFSSAGTVHSGPGWLAWSVPGLLALGLVVAVALPMAQPGGDYYQDYLEYWAAGRLILNHQNPYDPHLLYPLQVEQRPDLTAPVMMWNPPWTLPLVMPFGLLPCPVGYLLWETMLLVLVLWAAFWTWQLYQGPGRYYWLSAAISLSFIPTYFALHFAQISPVVWLGLVGFLYFEKRGHDGLAGAATMLAAVKPQLVYLFALALLVWILKQRRWRVLGGAALAFLTTSAISVAFDPGVFGHFWKELSQNPPTHFNSPTLGTFLRLGLDKNEFRWQYVPTVAGLIWLGYYWKKHHQAWSWSEQAPVLVLASFLTASYGAWQFDQVVMLLPILQSAVWICRSGLHSMIGFAVLALVGFDILALWMRDILYSDYHWFIWMTPMILYYYLTLRSQWKNRVSVSAKTSEVFQTSA